MLASFEKQGKEGDWRTVNDGMGSANVRRKISIFPTT